jgi:hypothetical protein
MDNVFQDDGGGDSMTAIKRSFRDPPTGTSNLVRNSGLSLGNRFSWERIMSYDSIIKKARLLREVKSTLTTGDLEYPGTALEVYDEQGNEMFHVVIDMEGEIQILFLRDC